VLTRRYQRSRRFHLATDAQDTASRPPQQPSSRRFVTVPAPTILFTAHSYHIADTTEAYIGYISQIYLKRRRFAGQTSKFHFADDALRI